MTEEIKTTELSSLIGKPIDELTPLELGQLASQLSGLTSQITERQQAIKDTVQKEEFGKIAEVAKNAAIALGWMKLPKLTLVPDTDGKEYAVSYAVTKVKGTTGKRSAPDVNGGAITINKIGVAMGGIAWFRDSEGKDHENIKDLVKALKHPDTGGSEADRCWDISKKGISASDIVIKYHASEVTLVFNDGTEKLVKDAAEEMKEARRKVAA